MQDLHLALKHEWFVAFKERDKQWSDFIFAELLRKK